MELDMVADMEVDKVADMVADININIDMEIQLRVGWSRGLINWAQTCSTRSLPGLRIF